MFDLRGAAGVLFDVNACRPAHPHEHIELNVFDSTRGFETMRISFIVNRPPVEQGFHLQREEVPGRTQRYAVRANAVETRTGGRN